MMRMHNTWGVSRWERALGKELDTVLLWDQSNVSNNYPFKCNIAKHGARVKTERLFSFCPHAWPLVKFTDVLKVPDASSVASVVYTRV